MPHFSGKSLEWSNENWARNNILKEILNSRWNFVKFGFVIGWHYMHSSCGKKLEISNKNWRSGNLKQKITNDGGTMTAENQ